MMPEPERLRTKSQAVSGQRLEKPLLTLDVPFRDPVRRTIFSILKLPLSKLLHLNTLNSKYAEAHVPGEDHRFTDRALGALNIRCDVSEDDIARIPTQGPVVVVSNHPFGAVEGMLLISMLASVRRDVKFLANFILARIPEMCPWIIQVDPFGSAASAGRNIRPMREAMSWLREGGMLGVFPAGEVSHLTLKQRRITDPPWSDTVARLIRKTEATVLPIYFGGHNSTLFQILGLVHPRLRTVMLPRELIRKCNSQIPMRIGNPIPFRKMSRFEKDSDLTEYIRMRTYFLAKRPTQKADEKEEASSNSVQGTAILPPVEAALIRKDLNSLPAEQLLAESGDYQAYCTRKNQSPHLMQEIGRLREVTFREVGEGTGKETDLDEFDDYYTQLFVWNKVRREIVGAYRLGLSDEIIAQRGIKGLYTRSLFKFNGRLMDQIGPAIELGRSFIRVEYQREYAPLHLLWMGIGQFVLRHPKYRMLFGPVSITNRYQSVSRHLLMDFLKLNNFAPRLASMVKPTNPMKAKKGRLNSAERSRLVNDLDDVTTLITELEADKCGIPVLLKHYLRLGGQLLGFNLDPQFNDALDGLILVDLLKTPRRVLDKYLGERGAGEFLAQHEVGASQYELVS